MVGRSIKVGLVNEPVTATPTKKGGGGGPLDLDDDGI